MCQCFARMFLGGNICTYMCVCFCSNSDSEGDSGNEIDSSDSNYRTEDDSGSDHTRSYARTPTNRTKLSKQVHDH